MIRASFKVPIPLLIFLLAVGVRLTFVHLFAQPPVNDLLWNDAVGWNLAQGHGYTASQSEPRVPGIFRTPGYPAFLAIVYWLFGHSYNAVYTAQSILDAGSAILIGTIALHYFPKRISLLTSLLYAIYPYPAMFCPVLHQDILLVFCVLFILFLLTRAIKSDGQAPWILVGVAAGLTALVKANMVLFIAVPAAAILFYFRTRRIQRLAVVLGSMIVVLLPWIIRNYVVFGSFPPLAAGATGTNLRLVVLELKGGEQAVREVGLSAPNTDLKQLVGDGQDLIKSEKSMAEIAFRELRKLWPQYSLLILKHIPRLWISKYSRWHSQKVALAGNILSWVVLVSGLLGMFLLRKKWRQLMPLYLTVFWITLLYAAYTVEARYTLPARPVMLCFVAAMIAAVLEKIWPGIFNEPFPE